MQINSLYLYSNKIDVYTNTLAAWQPERYRRVYNRNLKIYRSVDNRIDLQVRNSDQKAISVTGSILVFNLISREEKKLVLSKDCVSVSADSTDTGKVYFTLTQNDMYGIESGFYEYTITQEIRKYPDGTLWNSTTAGDYIVESRTPLYVDSQYGVINTIEVSGDVQGGLLPSLPVNTFKYTNPFTVGVTGNKYYTSSLINANPKLGTPQTFHTFQFYTTNYNGNVIIQGSIDQSADPKVWVEVSNTTVTDSDITYKNVEGKYNWFRIIHTPTTLNTGTVDKVLYR